MTPSPRTSAPVRKVFAAAVTLLAAVACLASSSGDSISVPPISGSVVVSHDQPEARIPFTLTASPEAGRDINAYVGITPTWADTDEITISRGLDVFVVSPRGPMRDQPNSIQCSWHECVGTNELVIRWPLEIETGQATVAWTVSASAWFDLDKPPEGAEITLEEGHPTEAEASP